jgi:peroxiredoxin
LNVKRLFLATALCWLTSLTSVAAEPEAPADGVPVDPAVRKLDDLLTRAAAVWSQSPSLRVEAKTDWTVAGDQSRAGVTHCRLSVRQPGQFRLEVFPDDAQKVSLLCASDGKTLTRLYQSGQLTLYSQADGGLAQVLDDALTDSCVKGTGLSVILRPDAQAYLMSTISDVKDCGREQVQGQAADHFSAAWFGGSRLDFWIAAGDSPVLLRWKRVQKVDLGGRPQEIQMDGQLQWDLKASVSEEQTEVRTPPGAIEVKDLQTYLLRGGTDALLGQLAPPAPAQRLDGADWDLARHRGEHVVVLFFFSTWAVPSTQDMPTVLAFINECADRGVVFYAIDVGESREPVKAFLDSIKYSHPVVLDPEQKVAEAYRVTSLPVTVLIAKDGTVQAAHVGTAPEVRTLIRRDLELLVAGKLLVETKK